jgi:hypothetical protein
MGWQRRTGELLARLEAGREGRCLATFDPREVDRLPAPVQRYFGAALVPGQPIIAGATIEHAGTFNMSAEGERWVPFTSVQRVVTRRPGFVWDARIRMFPGLDVRVHDAYAGGEGILRAALLGVVPLMDVHGTPELAQGELMRYLAEALWYPTALLPGEGVCWEAEDARSARATISDGGTSVTLAFAFRDDGLVESVRARARGRSVGKRVIPTPWEVRLSDYRRGDGPCVPYAGEVAWLLPEGRLPYWRGTIAKLSYEFAN